MNKYFDDHAIDWDSDPKKTERAVAFAKEINEFIRPNKKLNALEFGCGTGLLSFQLKDYFKSITLADNSLGMIKVLQEKIAKNNVENFNPLYIDIEKDKLPINEFDVVYTLMTLHHISNLDEILTKFNSSLKLNGYLCIADLVQEDGSFHSQYTDFKSHNGFKKDELSNILLNNGFKLEYYNICFEIEKESELGIKKYPLFLIICKKK